MIDLDDQSLIDLVKAGSDTSSDAMSEIIDRHSGIFIEIINQYVPCNNIYCNKDELISDKDFYIYKAVLKFNKDKGAKFSTHLGNEAKWLCLNTYNKNKNRITICSSDYDFDKDLTEDPHLQSTRKEAFRSIVKLINSHPDPRVKKIFTMRYIQGEKNKLMPWKKISQELDMSIQGCINIHNSVIKKLQKKVK